MQRPSCGTRRVRDFVGGTEATERVHGGVGGLYVGVPQGSIIGSL